MSLKKSQFFSGNTPLPVREVISIVILIVNYLLLALGSFTVSLVLSSVPVLGRLVARPHGTFGYVWQTYFYRRIKDCWHRPIGSNPGCWIDVLERSRRTGSYTVNPHDTIRALNFGSYNYLGFAAPGGRCLERDAAAIDRLGASAGSTRSRVGCCDVHVELERCVAEFVGKEDCFCFAMGFATNSTGIPTLIAPGSLILSDSLNHTSIVTGCRTSGARIVPFRHGDLADLDRKLAYHLVERARSGAAPYASVVIIVEGIYSMEGDITPLPGLVALKRRYKAFLYVDEAHSVGALGRSGRGVCEHCGVDPADVDVLMGTFTKSFASIGGYIAGSARVIAKVRAASAAAERGMMMPPAAAEQIVAAMDQLRGEGTWRLRRLAENTARFRDALKKEGFIILGNKASPVVPLMVFQPVKMSFLSRELLKRHIAIVTVGFPAVPILENRIRFCLSSSHTTEDIDFLVRHLKQLGSVLQLTQSNRFLSKMPPEQA
eukprot:gnl/Chilomastix_cuspidata/5422.p1 GENE.gnl/Chilomastix_cuspidata/5422~~gnl/Chilomastix_cuspidata/5422.p1  ORF type:complete len:489 (+),score=197.07 gnl/Chilomastix_cuspidata/5422:285-1751(+)